MTDYKLEIEELDQILDKWLLGYAADRASWKHIRTELAHLIETEKKKARIDELKKMHVNINRNLGNYHAYKDRISELQRNVNATAKTTPK